MPVSAISSEAMSAVVSAMDDIAARWASVDPRLSSITVAPSTLKADLEMAAVRSYLSGHVPEKGSRVMDLVRQLVF